MKNVSRITLAESAGAAKYTVPDIFGGPSSTRLLVVCSPGRPRAWFPEVKDGLGRPPYVCSDSPEAGGQDGWPAPATRPDELRTGIHGRSGGGARKAGPAQGEETRFGDRRR